MNRNFFLTLLRETSGQDVIEYALLTAFIGLVGIVAWENIQTELAAHYGGWGNSVNNLSGCTPDPISTPGGGLVCSGGS